MAALLWCVGHTYGQRVFSNVENYTKTSEITYIKCQPDSLDFDRSGNRVTWDFMNLKCDGDTLGLSIQRPDSLARAKFPDANLMEIDSHGALRAYRKGGGRTFLIGFYDIPSETTIRFKESMLQSRRPVGYGDKISKKYKSTYAQGTQKMEAKGEVNLEADGSGTLLLPGLVVENTLRIKHHQEQEVAIEKYDTLHKTDFNTYLWFDDYHKSPVLKVTEVRSGDNKRQEILLLVEEREEWRLFR